MFCVEENQICMKLRYCLPLLGDTVYNSEHFFMTWMQIKWIYIQGFPVLLANRAFFPRR